MPHFSSIEKEECKIFATNDGKLQDLENEVNAWLEAQGGSITLTDRCMSSSVGSIGGDLRTFVAITLFFRRKP